MQIEQVFAIEHRAFIPEIKRVDPESRMVTHLISDASIDRVGDMIEPLGWDLANYLKSPVVLADHSYEVKNIIGKATEVTKTKAGLFATTQFYDIGAGAAAYHLVADGFAKAWSVGFKPVMAHSVSEGSKAGCKSCEKARAAQVAKAGDDDAIYIRGRHFTEQELLEYSLVAVPANPNAVSAAMSKGATAEGLGIVMSRVDRTLAAVTDAHDGANAVAPKRDGFIAAALIEAAALNRRAVLAERVRLISMEFGND